MRCMRLLCSFFEGQASSLSAIGREGCGLVTHDAFDRIDGKESGQCGSLRWSNRIRCGDSSDFHTSGDAHGISVRLVSRDAS